MRIGVGFPTSELGGDLGAVRAHGQWVQDLGYHHLRVYDHVVGADPQVHAGRDRNADVNVDVNSTFREPLVKLGYLAAVTTSLELVTGILILPDRRCWWPSRPPRWTYSVPAGCVWASGSVGTPLNTRRSERTSTPEARAQKSKSS